MNFLPTVDVLENVASGIAPLLFDVAVKSFLLLAATWVAASLLRRQSAATVHRIWTLGFLGCLLVPVITLVSPTWNFPILPAVFRDVRPQTLVNQSVLLTEPMSNSPEKDSPLISASHANQTLSPLPSKTANKKQAAKSLDGRKAPVIQTDSIGSTSNSPLLSGVADQAVRSSLQFWTLTFCAFWLAVALGFLFRRAWHQLTLARIVGRCQSLNNEAWTAEVADVSQSLGLNRDPKLLKLADAVSPMIAGIFRAVVMLPGDANDWLSAKRRSVLLHELAHDKRHDVLTQTVAGLVCALQWFNPIGWYGLSQMRKLRELACDDLVIASGQQPADYADVLLEVARSYRHRHPAVAVGMARRANVENRILAILDRARSHVSVSRRVARLLLVSTVVLAVVIGSVRLESQAKPQAVGAASDGDASVAEEKVEADDSLRTMKIHILNDAGDPLEGAKLHANAVQPKGVDGDRIVNRDLVADDAGIVTLSINRKYDTVKLWVWASGKVCEFAWLKRGPEQQDALLPREYEFRLSEGREIGGRIVNAEGDPIEGVRVRVRIEDDEPAWAVDTEPMISTWLSDSFDQPAVKTDAQGRWRLGNAPAPRSEGDDFSLLLKLSHDDYITDENWGDAQRSQGISTANLRTGDATIVLQRGTSISGVVADLEGNPVEKGWVVWSDTPYFFDGTWEAAIDSEGRFRTPPLTVGEHPITIVAPGYAAQRRVVRVGSDPNELRFELRPGKRIEIRFVDTAGNPVPRTAVYLANDSYPNTWNGSNALHNQNHPNVPGYGISRRADDNGVYIWDWAPEEPVRYSVGAKGFAPQEVSLVAKSEPHIITLANARVVVGLVTDVTTGEHIKKFQAMPVIVFRPNHFHTRYTDTKQGVYGLYVLPLRGSSDPEDRYRVRIEAEGYRSVVSEESYGPKDGRVTLNVQLESTPARKGRVVDAEGRSVSEATVIEATATWVPSVRNGDPDSYGERIVRTDSDGRFVLSATTEPVRVRVLHDAGISEKLVNPEDDAIGDLQLQPWASVSGRLVQEGQPIGDQSIYFSPLVRRGLGEARFQDSYHATTSPDGGFSFERLAPGVCGLP